MTAPIRIIKRTFEALKYPKGSAEREKLNEEIETSEYLEDEKYILEGGTYQLHSFKTLEEAEEYIRDTLP